MSDYEPDRFKIFLSSLLSYQNTKDYQRKKLSDFELFDEKSLNYKDKQSESHCSSLVLIIEE